LAPSHVSLHSACCAAVIAVHRLSLIQSHIRERNSVLAFQPCLLLRCTRSARAFKKPLAPVSLKGLIVGVLFTAGCAFPIFAPNSRSVYSAVDALILAVFFAALAWLNCSAIDAGNRSNAQASPLQPSRWLQWLACGPARFFLHQPRHSPH